MIKNFEIKKKNFSSEEILECSNIHINEIDGGLLKNLGINFLCRIYKHIFLSKYSFLIIAKNENKTIGFFAGCTNQKKFYLDFIYKNILFIFKHLTKLFNLSMFSKIIKINKFFIKDNQNLPNALILNFCVDSKFQSKGFGKKLFNEAIKSFKENKIDEFKIKTSTKQQKAVKLYKSHGAIKIKNSINSNSKNEEEIIFLFKLT